MMLFAVLFIVVSSVQKPVDYRESDRKNIRIVVDYSAFSKKIDPFMCYQDGQTVIWNKRNISCTFLDIMNKDKEIVAKNHISKAISFLSDLIKINRMDSSITHSDPDIPNNGQTTQCDLIISVYFRSLENSETTLGKIIHYSPIDSRPISASMSIDVSKIPQSEFNSLNINEEFHNHIVRELIRILGWSRDIFPKWLNRKTGLPWGTEFPITKHHDQNYPSIPFFILQTPMCHQYAKERWSIAEFAPGVKAGVELEFDGNNQYYASVSSRVFHKEILSSIQGTPSVLSDLTLSILEDMGWYSTQFKMAQNLLWGTGESFGDKKLSNFATGRPQIEYPKHYICSERDIARTTTCSFDQSRFSVCWDQFTTPVNCPGSPGSEDEIFCQGSKFYNPLNKSYRGKNKNDGFSVFKIDSIESSCFNIENRNDSLAILLDMSFGSDSSCIEFNEASDHEYDTAAGCYKTICDEKASKVTIHFGNLSYTCDTPGEVININHPQIRSFICPNPKVLCNSKVFYNKQIVEPSRIPLPGDDKKSNIGIIILSITILFLLIAAISFFTIKKRIDEESGWNQVLLN